MDGFVDSDWRNSITRRSTTGLLARFNRGVVQWRSKMQKTVAVSTAEAEYYLASKMTIEVLYLRLRNLLENMGLKQAPDIHMYEDNTSCINLKWGSHVIGGLERAKHIKHFAHEAIQNRQMRQVKVNTSKQLADIFTKPLQLPQFLVLRLDYYWADWKRASPERALRLRRGQEVPSRRCEDGCCRHRTPRDETRRPFGGVFPSKDSTRPKWSRSSAPVNPDPKHEWVKPDVQGLGFCR